MSTRYPRSTALAALALGVVLVGAPLPSLGHGDVVPQAVDVTGLPSLDGENPMENPFRDTEHFDLAVRIGDSAFNQNCARCHGLGAVSGGLAPDLRYLEIGLDDEYYAEKVRQGVVRNGVTYMPAFADVFSEEAIWAIRSYLDTVAE